MTRRLVLIEVAVQPRVLWVDDDGSTAPGPPLQAFTCSSGDELDQMPTRLREGVEALRESMKQEADEAAAETPLHAVAPTGT